MNSRTKYLVKAGIIASIYAALTLLLPFLSYGGLQVRFSEALTVLPWFTPAAIPGLFAGCLLANFFGSPLGMLDVVVGSLSTLVAAWMASKIKNKKLVPLPSIVINALAIPYVLFKVLSIPYLPSVFWVGLGQTLAVYGLGYPLLNFIDKSEKLKELIKK
ncbi:QueT transporter family protein [Alkalibacter mobilis]|uniref:QueT transporter family protein n=1 Tax=Alkalibacter mobilis TaxID=2787712 RepID=UPI00189CD27D|nr:QueT transporter family protein [Alkalibacter mobilis]MBF7096943.1 QueT transporter family protein [Alkalibacter mobilis]